MKLILALFLSIIVSWLFAYALAYWAARGWYDGKEKKHG